MYFTWTNIQKVMSQKSRFVTDKFSDFRYIMLLFLEYDLSYCPWVYDYDMLRVSNIKT